MYYSGRSKEEGDFAQVDNSQMNKQHVYDLFIKFLHRREEYENEKNAFFLEKLRSEIPNVTALNLTEVHVIACIGEHEPINLTSIAERMDISKGNISKICSKLTNNGWIRKSQLSDNKKEVYFRLTASGKKLFVFHEEQHGHIQEKFIRLLDRYDEAEVEFMKKFLADAIDYLGELS